MNRYSILIVLLCCILVDSYNRRNRNRHNLRSGNNFRLITRSSPPYCTRVTKDSSYSSIARFDYAIAYIEQGQTEAYQQLYCVNPAAVNKAVTTVCDWSAPPQVHFLLGDEYVHVVRQDPTGRFRGNAEILTYQFCGHRLNVSSTRSIPDVKVTAL